MMRLPVLAVIMFLLAPAHAAAQQAQAPPGSAGIQQYMETVPDAGGDRPVRPGANPRPGNVVDAATRRRLEAQGPRGKELLASLERAGTPVRSTSWGAQQGSRSIPSGTKRPDSKEAQPSSETGGSGAAAVVRSLAEPAGGGMGIALPLLLLGSLVAGVALGRRART